MRLTERWTLGLRSAVAATLGLGLALTIVTLSFEERSARGRLDRMADLVAGGLRQRIVQYTAVLRATRSYLEAEQGQIAPDEFAIYVASLELNSIAPGIQGIGVAPLTDPADTDSVARTFSRQHGMPIAVTPDTDQPVRAPIALLEPMDSRNRAALGYDMFAEPIRRAAILATQDRREPRASGPVQLVQEITADKQTGFLIYLRSTSGLSDVPSSGAVVYAPFRAGDLHREVLADLPDLPLTLRSIDLADPGVVLFENTPATLRDRLARRTVTRDVEVAGRQWRLAITPTAAFLELRDRSATVTVALLSLLLTSAVWVAMASQARSLEAARRTAALAERQAADRALLLREMKHRIKNHIARIQAIARHSIRGADDLVSFQRLFDGRLSALAKAQDALGQEGTHRADLRGLLRDELAQVLSPERVRDAMDGPDVTLDARETQAVGLAAHELLTNSMKYGAGDGDAAIPGLRVRWRIEARSDRRWLVIVWTEPGARMAVNADAAGSGGFGTQLIEALVEGDLGGHFRRSFDGEEMRVELDFPLSSS